MSKNSFDAWLWDEDTSSKSRKTKSRSTESRSTKSVQSDGIKVGELVRTTIPILIKDKVITPSILSQLERAEFSKSLMDLNYPMFKKIDHKLSIYENRLVKDYTRYYAEIYRINGEEYLLTSEWYERNKSYYTFWLNSLGYKI
jgi:hypothetical protein